MTSYYIVTASNDWSKEPTTAEEAMAQGFEVAPSRRHGDLQLFRNDVMCGWLFSSQADQMAFLASRGAI